MRRPPTLRTPYAPADPIRAELGYNPYDVRKKCDRERDGDLCYPQMSWIEVRPAFSPWRHVLG